MLNVDRLRALHAVATHGSIFAASEVLHVTTSAVSQQLAKLEREVGQSLLERYGRRVRLTDAGTLLISHTQQVMSLLEQAEAELDAHRGSVTGQITIAAFATAARGLAPHALDHLRTHHPQLRVLFREHEPSESIPLLLRRDLDVVLGQEWLNAPLALPPELAKETLLEDVADIALPAKHRLARKTVINLDDLADEPWITWPTGSICHDWLTHTLRARGIEPRVAHTAAEHSTQLALVAAGFGAAVIPRLGRETVPKGVRMVPSEPALRRQISVLWRIDSGRRTTIRAAVKAFHAAVSAAT
jgi:DNA-binding transcriptional LysR family regulator